MFQQYFHNLELAILVSSAGWSKNTFNNNNKKKMFGSNKLVLFNYMIKNNSKRPNYISKKMIMRSEIL